MKNLKKVISLILALAMVFTMTTTVFAEDAATYSITINNDKEGHTYKAYQIFAGTIDEKHDNVLGNIAWGDGISEDGQTDLGDAAQVAENLTDAASADALAEKIVTNNYLADVAGTATAPSNGKYVIANLESGYYLVVDSITDADEANDVTSKYIVQVVDDVSVTPKTGAPTFEKKVQDINDSTETALSDLQDSADYDIGDDVPFTLTATLPEDVETDKGYKVFKEYYLAFHDDMADGFTLNKDSFKVYLNEVSDDNLIEPENYEITYSTTDTDDFTLAIEDLKTVAPTAKGGDKVIVTYTAELNENANIGKLGNKNTANLEYSGNPNWTGEGKPEDTVETPDDTVIVFTYQVVIDKIDSEGAPLEGAEFTLYKKDPTNENAIKDGEMKDYISLTMTVVDGTEFSFKGLDDGEYAIVETTTPPGYNTIDAILFTVSAGHTITSDSPVLESFSAEAKDKLNVLYAKIETGKVTKKDGTEKEVTSGQIYTEVMNQKGSVLPETGGMGTTIFYVVGAILVLGAAVVMITRKRMSK